MINYTLRFGSYLDATALTLPASTSKSANVGVTLGLELMLALSVGFLDPFPLGDIVQEPNDDSESGTQGTNIDCEADVGDED